ncbi:MAG: hypothetical protein KDB57_08305 [Solirubrobacterales bacterium]|nr:hypothetical protein [Solirubrobacterales bacterium]
MKNPFRPFALLTLALFALLAVPAGSVAAPPANDNFSAAQTVGPALPVSVPASNIDATAEIGEPSIFGNSPQATVWFRWIAPANGATVVDLCGSEFSGSDYPTERIAVRTGASLLAQVLVAETAGACSLRFNAAAGTTYNIHVDYGNDQGTFTFRLRALSPPVNDNFANATAISPNLPAQVSGTTVDSGWQAGEPAALGGSGSARSVWHTWTPAAPGRVRINVCDPLLVDGAGNLVIALYTGNTLGTLVSAGSTNNCEMDVSVVSGTTYRLAFSGTVRGEMNYTLKLSSAPPPPNDNFANAAVIGPGLPVTANGDNDFATTEAGEPGHGGIDPANRSVWYRWTPTTSGPVRARGCSREYSARVSVYTGNTVGTLTRVNASPPYSPHCGVTFDAVAGTTYSIAVGGGPFTGAYGPFGLDVHRLEVPANDNLGQAIGLGKSQKFTVQGSTIDATFESGEPSHDYDYGQNAPSVWYRWTAPDDDPMIFEACAAQEPVRVAIYKGTDYSDLTKLVQSAEGCRNGVGGRTAIAPEQGTVYLLVVAPVQRDFETDFTLTGVDPSFTPVAAFNLKKAIAKCKKIKGKGAKAKRKRANCIRKARLKAAIIKCRKLSGKKAQDACIKKARKRYK